jgi:superoxide reductase
MAEKNGVYKCSVCGNVVSVIDARMGTLVCCGQNMNLMEEFTSEKEGVEKHVPVIEKTSAGIKVKVGSVAHPMEEKHYIEFIQLLKNNEVIAEKRLLPGEKPEAEFCIEFSDDLTARELCNIHGLWKTD